MHSANKQATQLYCFDPGICSGTVIHILLSYHTVLHAAISVWFWCPSAVLQTGCGLLQTEKLLTLEPAVRVWLHVCSVHPAQLPPTAL